MKRSTCALVMSALMLGAAASLIAASAQRSRGAVVYELEFAETGIVSAESASADYSASAMSVPLGAQPAAAQSSDYSVSSALLDETSASSVNDWAAID